MKFRHTFLIGRVAAFALLLISAGATSVAVGSSAQDDRDTQIVDAGNGLSFAHSQLSTAATSRAFNL